MQGIRLLFVGKTDASEIRTLMEQYTKRLAHFVPFECAEIPDIRNTKSLSQEEQKRKEGEHILSQVGNQDALILLDERGREFTSREFADYIEQKMNTLPRRLIMVVGGPYGFSPEVYERADGKVSLSRMTFSHQMVRLFVIEQLYRAFTILNGHPYHHD